jgi:phosphonate transport system ATP-binding protein
MTLALSLTDLNHQFEGTKSLSDVNLTMQAGERLALIGPSGAGKSTLLTLLDGRLRNWQGAADVLNLPLDSNRSPRRIDRADVGFIFQEFALVDRQSVYQNVMNGRLGRTSSWASLWGQFDDRDHAIVGSLLRDTSLAELAEKRADQLSGGQRQRVSVARCLAQEPKLILADEPVSNLDPVQAENILELITGEAQKRGIGVIFSSHQPALSLKFADRVVGLRDGQIIFDRLVDAVSWQEIDALYGGSRPDLHLRVVS